MLVTEAEAKTKRCIYMSAAIVRLPLAEKNAAILGDGLNCIGSACMAWRWGFVEFDGLDAKRSDRGFCGLAGSGGAP